MAEQSEREKAKENVAENRKAFHDYHLIETFEAGLVLLGTEVKAIREGRVNLRDSFARVEDGEGFIYNVHISSYSHRGHAEPEPPARRFGTTSSPRSRGSATASGSSWVRKSTRSGASSPRSSACRRRSPCRRAPTRCCWR